MTRRRYTNSFLGVIFQNIDNLPRHAAQLYEACGYFIISFICFYTFNKINKIEKTKKEGLLTAICGLLMFLLRFVIEFVKEPQNELDVTILTQTGFNLGQLLSLPFIFIFSILIIKRLFNKQ